VHPPHEAWHQYSDDDEKDRNWIGQGIAEPFNRIKETITPIAACGHFGFGWHCYPQARPWRGLCREFSSAQTELLRAD
jgi:hypothetical protein